MSKVNYWKIMTRRKPMPQQECCEESKLGRVFGTFDLTALGVSATLGVGVYVLAGHVAKDQAGPSVILSFLIAAGASFLAGLCYAEFSSRVPKSGSAYVFTYVAIGEFMAFIIGWNLLLEYIIGAASISKGLSLYIDSLINDTMKNTFKQVAPISWDFLSSYFDFFALTSPLLLGFALAFGLKKSSGINNILCILNLGVVSYVVVAVLFNADIRNWQIDPANVPVEYANSTGSGGFFPFGVSGTLKGAATCFFGFVGFDCIATTGEQVRNPQKAVPRAILLSLIIIFLAYFGVSLLTLMWPYYLLNAEAPLPHAFQEIGWTSSKWIVTVGGIMGLIASLFGAMFPLPRILYAMSQDGLMFREFGVISRRFETPVFGTLAAALLTGTFAALFDLAALVNMLSIGVLLAYTVVAISIIILRFSDSMDSPRTNNEGFIETSNLLRPGYNITPKGFMMQLVRLNSSRFPNTISKTVVGSLIVCYCVVSFALSFSILYSWNALGNGETWALTLVLFLSALLLLLCTLISVQPRQRFHGTTKPFQVKFVPFIPAISILVNIYLMLMLDVYTWIRFGIWMILGLPIYFACAWYFNPINTHKKVNDQPSSSTNIDEIIIDKTNMASNGNNRYDEIVTIKSNCDSENVIIIHENHANSRMTEDENAFYYIRSDDNETHLAIDMLDTILETEEENKSTASEINSQTNSSSSIKCETENVPVTQLTREHVDEIFMENKPNEKKNMNPVDPMRLRLDIEWQIDEILTRARESVDAMIQSDDENCDDENIFKNRKFLSHLSILMSKSNQSNELIVQTLDRKPATRTLKTSASAPDLKSMDSIDNEKQLNCEEEPQSIPQAPPLPLAFNTELFKKISTMKRKAEEKAEHDENLSELNSEHDDSLDIEPLSKERLREKLEKILRVSPTRPSTKHPIPASRRNVINKKAPEVRAADNNNNGEKQHPLPRDASITPIPISATMIKQRELFNEVLKKIKRNDNENS